MAGEVDDRKQHASTATGALLKECFTGRIALIPMFARRIRGPVANTTYWKELSDRAAITTRGRGLGSVGRTFKSHFVAPRNSSSRHK